MNLGGELYVELDLAGQVLQEAKHVTRLPATSRATPQVSVKINNSKIM
jgi:hypothetical protein